MSTKPDLMKIEIARAIALGFDNSGGVISGENLHAIVDSYELAISRLTAAEASAAASNLRSMESRAVSAESALAAMHEERDAARESAQAWERTAKDAEAQAAAAESAAGAATKESAEATATIRTLREALRLKMAEYHPHDPGFCAACDAGRAALSDRKEE
ncbi:MAG TPA: hypothetical protein VFN94_10960 [Nitrospiria bacterium]|nr:hypothetical protein [Nitrospiria bacterium]